MNYIGELLVGDWLYSGKSVSHVKIYRSEIPLEFILPRSLQINKEGHTSKSL